MNFEGTIELDRSLSTPLYQQVADWISGRIEEEGIAPGTMLPAVQSLCEMAGGVSHLTVRQGITQLVKMGVLYSVKGKGVFVAERSTSSKTRRGTVAFICSALDQGFAHQIVLGAEKTLRQQGYDLMLCNSEYSASWEAEYLRRAHASGADGVLLMPFMPPGNKELIESIIGDRVRPMPIVCVDRGFKNQDIPVVGVDNYRAAHEAVSYLLSLGHRRIGFIVNALHLIKQIEAIELRFEGYRKALDDYGIKYDPELVQEIGATMAMLKPEDVGMEHYGYQAMHKLLMLKNRPSAVFLLWDELAPGAVAAIRNHGLGVPEDISLVGFNDDMLSRLMTPALTTVAQPASQIGQDAANLVINLIEKKQVSVSRLALPTKLICRGTSALKEEQSKSKKNASLA